MRDVSGALAEVWEKLQQLSPDGSRVGAMLCVPDPVGNGSHYELDTDVADLERRVVAAGIEVVEATEEDFGDLALRLCEPSGRRFAVLVRPAGPALVDDLMARAADGGLSRRELQAAYRACVAYGVASLPDEPVSELFRAACASPQDVGTLEAWYFQRDQVLLSRARGLPAAWGGQYRVDSNLFVSDKDWAEVLGSERDQSLWMLVSNYGFATCEEAITVAEIVEHLDDPAWIEERRLDPNDQDANCLHTTFEPEDLTLGERANLDLERPDLIGVRFTLDDVLAARKEISERRDGSAACPWGAENPPLEDRATEPSFRAEPQEEPER